MFKDALQENILDAEAIVFPQIRNLLHNKDILLDTYNYRNDSPNGMWTWMIKRCTGSVNILLEQRDVSTWTDVLRSTNNDCISYQIIFMKFLCIRSTYIHYLALQLYEVISAIKLALHPIYSYMNIFSSGKYCRPNNGLGDPILISSNCWMRSRPMLSPCSSCVSAVDAVDVDDAVSALFFVFRGGLNDSCRIISSAREEL